MCIFDVWALDEAFGGVWEQYSQSKYQKTAKNAKIGKKMHFWKSRWGSRWSEPTIFNLSMDVLFHGKSKNGFKILGFLGKGGSRAQKWPPLGSNFFFEFFLGFDTWFGFVWLIAIVWYLIQLFVMLTCRAIGLWKIMVRPNFKNFKWPYLSP